MRLVRRIIHRYLVARCNKLTDKRSKIQELIDSEAGYRQVNKTPMDCYRRLSDVPSNDKLQWSEL